MSTYTFFYFLFLKTNPTDSNTKQGGEACAPHVIINNQLGEHLYHPFPKKKKKKKNQNTKQGINSAKYGVVSRDILILIKEEEEEASTLLFIQLYIYEILKIR